MAKNYSIELANEVKRFLQEDDWRFSFNEDTGSFQFGLSLSGKLKKITYEIRVKADAIIVYGLSPIGADKRDTEMVNNMARFLSRANYGLRNGCFEFDVSRGEVRYRSFINCAGVLPSQEVIRDSIYVTGNMFDRYAPGIVGIIFQGMDDKAAIELCEEGVDDHVRSLLAELISESGEDPKTVLEKLAERFGQTADDTRSDAESISTDDSEGDEDLEEPSAEGESEE